MISKIASAFLIFSFGWIYSPCAQELIQQSSELISEGSPVTADIDSKNELMELYAAQSTEASSASGISSGVPGPTMAPQPVYTTTEDDQGRTVKWEIDWDADGDVDSVTTYEYYEDAIDANENGIPEESWSGFTSYEDSDNDGTVDDTEATETTHIYDANENGVNDPEEFSEEEADEPEEEADLEEEMTSDTSDETVSDSFVSSTGGDENLPADPIVTVTEEDIDGDGVTDIFTHEIDSDGDGDVDTVTTQTTTADLDVDSDGNGVVDQHVDSHQTDIDNNNDGILDSSVTVITHSYDGNENGAYETVVTTVTTWTDANGDGIFQEGETTTNTSTSTSPEMTEEETPAEEEIPPAETDGPDLEGDAGDSTTGYGEWTSTGESTEDPVEEDPPATGSPVFTDIDTDGDGLDDRTESDFNGDGIVDGVLIITYSNSEQDADGNGIIEQETHGKIYTSYNGDQTIEEGVYNEEVTTYDYDQDGVTDYEIETIVDKFDSNGNGAYEDDEIELTIITRTYTILPDGSIQTVTETDEGADGTIDDTKTN